MSSRLRRALALVLTVVVCATALTPASVDAQDARELSIVVTTEGEATRGHNQSITWRVDVTCHAEVGECGNTVIESQLSPGIVLGDIDVASAPGFLVVNQSGDVTDASEPTLVQLQRGSDLLDGETVSFVVNGRVGPNADQGATLDHLVLAASNNTSTASAAAAPVVVANAARWAVHGFASGEATYGRNETHRVAVCGPTEANTDHGDLVLDVAVPDGSAIVDSGQGEITSTGLRWLVPAVTAADLAAEHDADLAAGRAAEYCHEFFPTVRWGAPVFLLGDAIPLTLSLTDSSGIAVDSLCVVGCRVDTSLSLIASTTVIEAIVAGPDAVNAGGLGQWDITFDASATVEPVQVPLLDVVLPSGLQLERIDLGGLPDGTEAQVYASTDSGSSFAPEPIRTGDTDVSMFERSAFDAAVGASLSINALQIRFTSVTEEPLLQAGEQPSIALITSPDPVQPPVGSAELCAMATSANAASIEGRSCYAVPVQDAAASFAPVASVTSPAAPTADQIVSTTVQIPMSNGAAIIDPIVGALLPAGFEFRDLDEVNAPQWIAAPPRPIIETTPDHDGTGRTLVTFHWTDTADDRLASHEFAWTPAEMRAAGIYSHLDLELVWRIAAPAGHPAGADTIDIAATSLISPPASCADGAELRDDQLGLGTALVCATEATTDTASGASLTQTNLAAGIELLPFEPIDATQTWCDPTRIDDIEWTSSTCAAPSTPNGRVQFRTEVTNTGNRDLTELWSYGLLPLLNDVGIDPDTWQTPRASELAASLTGPLVVTGLPEPVEADDVLVEYSSATDPCRSELSEALAPWPPACVDDWTASPQSWAEVTAWRVHVPWDRSPFAGATTFEISGEMLVAADADFETLGTAVVAQAGFDSIDATWVRTAPQPISIVVPREDDIIAADPALLPHDLALVATINAEDSLDLHDGPHGGDAFVIDIDVINQGAPLDSIDVALHPDLSVVINAASGSVLTDDGGSITWSVTPGSPAVLALSGTLARADQVRVALPLRISDEWASATWSENPLNLIAEIARLDAAGAAGPLIDHDSIADLDPTNDVAPAAPGDAGDGVVTGDGQPDSGVDADPVADDEDDHDIAGVPLWDLALDVVLSDEYDVALEWADPVAEWVVTVENNGPSAAYEITVEQSLPAGMTWVDAGAPSANDLVEGAPSITISDQGWITIDRLDPGAVLSWKATARATDPDIHDFVFEAAVTDFADQAALEEDPSPLVRDLDDSDLAGASAVWLPWDVAVALHHRSTTGLPISSSTTLAFDVVVQNVGRNIDIAVVDVQLGEGGLGALAPDPGVAIVDELGRPIRTTWDLSDPARPRIQVERSDGVPLGHGARVVVPVHASFTDLSVDPTALEVTAMLSGLDAASVPGPSPDQAVSAVDVNSTNDQSMLVVPMWDLALSVADDAPILRTVDDRVVADWMITIDNQGNRDASDIVVEIDLGERLVAETPTPVIVPFLAPGEQVDLVVVSGFTDGFDGSFAVTAQIASFGDANRVPQRDVDSRPGELATVDEPFEDDEQRLDRSLPSAIELAVEHRLTTGLPIQPGDSSVTFDVTVRNVGRPLNEIEVALAAPELGPVVVDAADAPYTLRAGDDSGSLVLVLPADAPLMPDGIVTLPVTVPIPPDWDGATPRLLVEAANAKAPAAAPMSFWDVALDVELAPEQPERISTSEPVQWALTVANEGNQDAHAVLVAVALPAGMSWAGVEGSGVSSAAEIGVTGEVLVSLDRVPAGETATVILSTDLNETDRSLFRLVADLVDFDADADPANERNPLAGDIDSTPRNVAARSEIDGVSQAALNPAEDDQGAADVSLPADVALDVVPDPATTPRAGATSSWTISATNQGLDLADATFVLDLDDRWVGLDAATLPTVTDGAAALAVTWDLTDPMAPQARVTGDWPSAATVTIPLALTVASGASAAGTPLTIGIATEAVDDDGFPATPAPVLDDVDGDAAALIEVDLFDLALVVRVDASAGLPPEAESVVTFFIDVINQGTVPATGAEVALYPSADQWLPLANGVVAVVDATNPLEPGATVTTPVTLTLAPDADLGLASVVAEIASASGIDFDSTPDSDSTNDAAPAAAGDPTDDATDNRSGDEDDHDLADVQPPTSVLGNQVWFDADHDGLRDDNEQPAVGVLIELLLDANSDGTADDRDLSGTIDNADRLATTTTDADGLFRFDGVAAGTYLIAIPPSQFTASGPLAGWSASIVPEDAPVDGANDGRLRSDGGMTSTTITVTGSGPLGEEPNNASEMRDERTDLTVDFGLGQWSLGNQVWYDTIENGLFEAGEEGVSGARLYLFVDANEDGTADDANADGALTAVDAVATTTADTKGRYRFDGLGAGTYIVAVADVTMRGTLGDWAISRFSRSAYSDRDDDSNAAGWSGLHVLSFPVRMGDGDKVNLTVDFGFELAEVQPIVWPQTDLTGFNNPTTFAPTNEPAFFGPSVGEDLTDFESFGDIDLFEEGEDLGESFDFVEAAFFEDGPEGPLAFTGSDSRTLVSWAAMLIVFGAVLVGVSREPDEG